MFIDNVKIEVKAGRGGNGCESFYRDKYMRYPRPDGGDGGKGADIIIKANSHLYTLYDFKFRQHFKGEDGRHGSGNNKKGRDASDLVIKVPVGTIIKDADTNCLLRDLDKNDEAVVVAKGGRGGLGNQYRKKEATSGGQGEEYHLILDLKVIADVGIVGFPNAGKSTLISKITQAQPKIATYPFTTKSPVLGVLEISDGRRFVIADIPGLIQGSAQGKGLGDRFLRHIERTRILVHLIDISGIEGRDPLHDYKTINQELKSYGNEIDKKTQIIVANKMDLPQAEENLKRLRAKLRKKIIPISALKEEGLKELVDAIRERL